MPEEVLVSAETGDDAAVYRLSDGQALVQTVDFFTPIVDDAYDWGRIAAANAFSDVYAMGARPALALNIAGWPVEELPLELLSRVLEGGAAMAARAGVAIVGGHTITDVEPKYGMAVTGFAEADRIVRNSTAVPGDELFLTKPIGIGIVATAIKQRKATEEQVLQAIDVMTDLNEAAAEAMVEAGVDAATDVTGFGLLGHLRGMLAASRVSASVEADGIELLPGVLDLAAASVVPGGTVRNHEFLAQYVSWGSLSRPEQLVLADAQTSGGLLLATRDPASLHDAAAARGVPLWRVGIVHEGQPGRITVKGRLAASGAGGIRPG